MVKAVSVPSGTIVTVYGGGPVTAVNPMFCATGDRELSDMAQERRRHGQREDQAHCRGKRRSIFARSNQLAAATADLQG